MVFTNIKSIGLYATSTAIHRAVGDPYFPVTRDHALFVRLGGLVGSEYRTADRHVECWQSRCNAQRIYVRFFVMYFFTTPT